MNRNAKSFIVAAQELFGKSPILTRDGIQQVVEEKGVAYPYWLVTKSEYRFGRGKYKLPSIFEGTFNAPVLEPEVAPIALAAQVVSLRQTKLQDDSDAAIPEKFANYVPFGFFKDLQNIVRSKMFYPVFITGHSGNGKTLMVEQVCAELNRECIRVNISIETDESDLLGGPVLVDGNTPFRDGPVLLAMKRGAILLIDEVDRGSNKLMCMQGILEGKAFYNKKTGEVVKPAPGFNVIATANSKGQGTDEGKYLVQILDSAFLERFPITVEQDYPTPAIEKKILAPLFAHADKEFVDNLVQWADVVRQSYKQGATDELISTRRLVHIAKAFDIFKDRMKAITLCLNRFDEETKTAFLDLYSKVDAKVEMTANTDSVLSVVDNDIPF